MRLNGIIIIIYALIVLAGGMIGFAKANSIMSLIMGMLFALGLLLSAVATAKNITLGYYASLILTALLTIFFVYRYILTQQFMPAGLMSAISGIVMILLLLDCSCKKR